MILSDMVLYLFGGFCAAYLFCQTAIDHACLQTKIFVGVTSICAL